MLNEVPNNNDITHVENVVLNEGLTAMTLDVQ